MWKRRPNYDHLRVFGAVGYARKNQPRFDKFEDRSEKVVFLGYATNSKEYLVKEYSSNRIMKVKTAHFYEETKYKVASDARRPRRENTIDELKDYWLDIGDNISLPTLNDQIGRAHV